MECFFVDTFSNKNDKITIEWDNTTKFNQDDEFAGIDFSNPKIIKVSKDKGSNWPTKDHIGSCIQVDWSTIDSTSADVANIQAIGCSNGLCKITSDRCPLDQEPINANDSGRCTVEVVNADNNEKMWEIKPIKMKGIDVNAFCFEISQNGNSQPVTLITKRKKALFARRAHLALGGTIFAAGALGILGEELLGWVATLAGPVSISGGAILVWTWWKRVFGTGPIGTVTIGDPVQK
ncbi:MAG TPA: hypothetical protein VK469_14565 [Candidatus Kapabacteria bacterium]|nr:hypothetical protein [Candidatus Kapabacteria bacterium]